MEAKVKNPHRTQAISWRDGAEKEEVVNILNSPEIDSQIPDEMKWYQGHNSAGKRVLWACRKIRELARAGMLSTEKSLFGKPAEVEALEGRVAELEAMLKQAQGGEQSYIDDLNEAIRNMDRQGKLLKLYRRITEIERITVDEGKMCYKGKYDDYWNCPAL